MSPPEEAAEAAPGAPVLHGGPEPDSTAEVIPVVKCDGRPIGTGKPGPVFRQLRERFQQLIRQ